jgi:rhamnosyl/mannosyltransferase
LRSEAYGLCQIEAMACGTPVISCLLDTGVPYVNLDGVSGLVCEPGSALTLRESLNRLLRDDDLRRQLGKQAKKRAYDVFSADKMIDKVKNVYQQVLARNYE